MPRKHKPDQSSGYTILLVDDNREYLEATRLLLQHEGHHVICAQDGFAALTVLQQEPVDLLLLDYYMPGMTGEEVVVQLRRFNPYVQVILQTGYASEQPPRDLLRRLDIQGYYDKSEGPDKLLLWTDVGLRAAYTVQLLYKSRQGLRYILDVTPDMHKIQPLTDLLQGILLQVAGLLGAANSFLAVLPKGATPNPTASVAGFLALAEGESELRIRAGTGRFAGQDKVDNHLFDKEKLDLLGQALQQGAIRVDQDTTMVPLRVGELTLGIIYLDRPATANPDVELLQIFANQATVAIQNSQLYEMAALDPLTGVYTRRFLEQCLLRELRTTFRTQQPLAVLMLDVDNLKHLNDVAGHLTGDQALATLGKVLRHVTRSSDSVGRYGGDEFSILLPNTPRGGAMRFSERLVEALRETAISGPQGESRVQCSIGITFLEPHLFVPSALPHPIPLSYFEAMAQAAIAQADQALYEAKRAGGGCAQLGAPLEWLTLEDRDPKGSALPKGAP